MKIVHLITTTDVGGAERVLERLVSGTASDRLNHVVVSMTPIGPVGAELQAAGIPVHSLEMRPGKLSLGSLLRLRRLLRKLRPDCLHCWMYHANLLGIIAGKLAGVPYILWGIRTASMDFSKYRRLTRWVFTLNALLSYLPDAIIVNSGSGAASHAASGFNRSRMLVIPNGFDTTEFHPDEQARLSVRQELELAPEAPLIGYIARYDFAKDHETFLRAAALLAQRHPTAFYLLCGSDVMMTNPELARLVRQHELQDHVRLIGPRKDIPRLTAALDIACSTSRFEGFPNVLGEAMCCAVPCVATDVGDAATIIGETGEIVPPGDARAFADACAVLLEMPATQRLTMGLAARRRVEENYSMQSFLRKHESVYSDVAAGRKPIPDSLPA